MIELGKKQILTVKRIKTFGVYLGCEGEDQAVLLPAKYVPEGSGIGDEIEVFVYRDSQDRLVATTLEPKLRLGETAVLEVKEVGKIGAFLDWGLEKDLFLPFKEQTWRPESGQSCLVALYIDKSHRLCATMKVYEYLKTDSDYQKNDYVEGIVYQINEHYGAFVIADKNKVIAIRLRSTAWLFSTPCINSAYVMDEIHISSGLCLKKFLITSGGLCLIV